MDSMGIQTAHSFIATDGNMLFNVRSESLSVDFFLKILKSILIIKVFYAFVSVGLRHLFEICFIFFSFDHC